MSQGNAAAIRRRVKNAENLPTKQPTNTNKNTYTPEPQSN